MQGGVVCVTSQDATQRAIAGYGSTVSKNEVTKDGKIINK